MTSEHLQSLILTGEGQLLEFKCSETSHLGREICTFAEGMMQRMDLVEKVCSGLKRIRDMRRDYPCAQPIIAADQEWYCFTLQRVSSEETQGGSITLTDRQQEILQIIKNNNKTSYRAMADHPKINESAVRKHLEALKNKDVLKRIAGTRGHWEVIDHKED